MNPPNPFTAGSYFPVPLRNAASRPPSPPPPKPAASSKKRQTKGQAQAQPRWELPVYYAQTCNVSPVGQCRRAQYEASLYCRMHTCTAMLEDGTRCCNLIINPHQSTICTSGYHRENNTLAPLLNLIERRKHYNLQLQADFEEYEFKRHAAEFELSSSASTTSLSSRTS